MRIANWQLHLADTIGAADGRKFAWGTWDCCQFCARVVEALTGRDYREIFPHYETEREALVIISRSGGVSGLITKALGESKPVAQANRGDIVLCEFGRGLQPAVCIGVWCVAPGEVGLVKRPMSDAVIAWSV